MGGDQQGSASRWIAGAVAACGILALAVGAAGTSPAWLVVAVVALGGLAMLFTPRGGSAGPDEAGTILGPVTNPFLGQADEVFASGEGNPAVLVLQLVGFRDVQTVLGDRRADEVLEHVAARVADVAREWPVGVLEGERFAVAMRARPFLPAHHIGRQVQERIGEPLVVAGVALRLRTAVGVALGDHDAETLLKRAGVAAQTAQARNEDLVVHSVEDPEVVRRRLAVVTGLSNALDDPVTHGFHAAFQPIVDRDGALVSAEALARWEDPELGLVTPDQFIPLAEQTGLVRPLFSYMLNTSLQTCREWLDAGVDAGVSINASPLNVRDPLFASELTHKVERHDLTPDRVTVEITESGIVQDDATVGRTLRDLRRLGFQVALDDFGVGQSSLSRLRDLPVSAVKLDKSFVGPLLTDTRSAGIIKATVEVCHLLGIVVVAEGVETDEQADRLIEMGVERLQGFLFSSDIDLKGIVSGPIMPDGTQP